MKFTEQEIVFLTSVSRGRVPFGVTYRIPEKEERETYIKETIKSLQEKAILDKEGKLTQEGAQILYLWEQYRGSRKHIRLNHVNAAVLPQGTLMTVVKSGDGYEMGCIQSALFMTELLKHADYLCQEEKESKRGKWDRTENAEWPDTLEEVDGCILLCEYDTGRLVEEKVYYWKEQKGYLYHKTRGRLRELSPAVMRKQIYRILEGSE